MGRYQAHQARFKQICASYRPITSRPNSINRKADVSKYAHQYAACKAHTAHIRLTSAATAHAAVIPAHAVLLALQALKVLKAHLALIIAP